MFMISFTNKNKSLKKTKKFSFDSKNVSWYQNVTRNRNIRSKNQFQILFF